MSSVSKQGLALRGHGSRHPIHVVAFFPVHLRRIDTSTNRTLFYCDLVLDPIVDMQFQDNVRDWLLVHDQLLWILSDSMQLVQFAYDDLESMIDSNRHAYIQCASTEPLPLIECGTIPQQRFRLIGQKSISHFSVCPSPSTSHTIVAVGAHPCICTYLVTSQLSPPSLGSKAVSVAASLYGAVKSLASYPLSHALTSSWGWNRAEEHQTPLPRAATVYSDFAVQDAARRCERVWTSPDGRYCVVSDALHRVVLLDLRSLVVLNLWKGW